MPPAPGGEASAHLASPRPNGGRRRRQAGPRSGQCGAEREAAAAVVPQPRRPRQVGPGRVRRQPRRGRVETGWATPRRGCPVGVHRLGHAMSGKTGLRRTDASPTTLRSGARRPVLCVPHPPARPPRRGLRDAQSPALRPQTKARGRRRDGARARPAGGAVLRGPGRLPLRTEPSCSRAMFPALREGPGRRRGGGGGAALTARLGGGPARCPSRPPGGLPAGGTQVPRRAIPEPPASPRAARALRRAPPPAPRRSVPSTGPEPSGAGTRDGTGAGPAQVAAGAGSPGSFKRGARAPRAGRAACAHVPPRPARAPLAPSRPIAPGGRCLRSATTERGAVGGGPGVLGSRGRGPRRGSAANRRCGRPAPGRAGTDSSASWDLSSRSKPPSSALLHFLPPAGAQGHGVLTFHPPFSAGRVHLTRVMNTTLMNASWVARHRTKHSVSVSLGLTSCGRCGRYCQSVGRTRPERFSDLSGIHYPALFSPL